MKRTKDWHKIVARRADLAHRKRAVGIFKNWFQTHKSHMDVDWCYAGWKHGEHRFKIRDPEVALLFKLTFG